MWMKMERIDNFGDLIKLWFNLINEIRGVIEEISKIEVD
jgi:hypothetical protein